MRGRAVFTSFYEQLKGVRAFHRKYPNTVISHEPSLDDVLNPQVPVRLLCCLGLSPSLSSLLDSLVDDAYAEQFSGEERFGKYVDLHAFYARFLNIPALKWCGIGVCGVFMCGGVIGRQSLNHFTHSYE